MVVVCGPCCVCKGQSHDVNTYERKTRKGNGHLVKNVVELFIILIKLHILAIDYLKFVLVFYF